MSFNIALSGLNAASQDLSVIGNNIANSNTVGFKLSRAEFADLYNSAFSTAFAGGGFSGTIGGGTRLASVAQQFNQGNFQLTGNALDFSIAGNGFFIVNDQSTGQDQYTRAGQFRVDRDGFVVNSFNQRLQAFDVVSPTIPSFNTGTTIDLQLPSEISAPSATTSADLGLNLDLDAPDLSTVVPLVPFDANIPGSYSHSTSFSIFDSQGGDHTATMYFRNEGGTWDTYLYVDGTDLAANEVGMSTLDFDSNGALTTAQPINFGTYDPGNGAALLDIDFDFTGSVEYDGAFATNALSQDGFATGRLINIETSENGVVSARYSNGRSTPFAQLALASFTNVQGLTPEGQTNWSSSFSAGDRILGAPGSGGLGTTQSGGLEQSNVELSTQLVNLIVAQRNFQANAQAISAEDTVTQTIINI